MLMARRLYRRFGEQQVLDGVDLQAQRGTVTTIIGRSGGGKSVLLRHLTGLEKPDSGEILVDGEDLVLMSDPELNEVRKRFGILFQGAALFDSYTVFDNVAFPLREHTDLSEDEIEDTVHRLLARSGLTGHEFKSPSQISGGMRKRVGLARALAMQPELVFFDEPTSGLDPITKAGFYELIKETHRESAVTYVIVSHDIRGSFEISDQIMMLWDGKILCSGSPDEIRDNPDPVVRQFITGSATGPISVY
jgi:phospholipid/cholesterol/gamma-HCH transport system ATP-binding protein